MLDIILPYQVKRKGGARQSFFCVARDKNFARRTWERRRLAGVFRILKLASGTPALPESARSRFLWETIITDGLANLNAVLGVKQLFTQFLRLPMVGLLAPRAHGFLGFKFNDRNAFAVPGGESFDGDKARHPRGEVVHARGPALVFFVMLRPQAGSKNRDDHCS